MHSYVFVVNLITLFKDLIVWRISNISQLSLWRNRDAWNPWRKKGEDSQDVASISGEKLSDPGDPKVTNSNQIDNPLEPSDKENQHDDLVDIKK